MSQKSSKSFELLNAEQKKAVLTSEGPVLILAGAGAGKTKTLVERIRHLVREGVAPSSILAITFTNKAAREMRERVEASLKSDPDINRPISMSERPFVSTFHSLGVHILREQATKIGLKRNFAIFDRDDSKKAVREALNELGLDPKTHEPGAIIGLISKIKSDRREKDKDYGGYFRQVVNQVLPRYEAILKRDNALDFDDLLLKTASLLREDEESRRYYQRVWQYLHIDEYQDTNPVQYEISRLLVGTNRNICVVGDADQNIYSWRGADLRNILDFEKDYPGASIIKLEENYRSTKNILQAANRIIEKNKIRREKNLFTTNEPGEKILFFRAFDEAGEAEFVAERVLSLIKEGLSPGEIAVLYRANFQSRVLEEAFMSRSIPYQILGTRFFERKEVKDIIAYLRAALSPESIFDLKRILNTPARGIGKTTMLKIFSAREVELPPAMKRKLESFRELLNRIALASKTKKVSETVLEIIKATGLEKEWKEGGEDGAARLENAYELVNFASRYDEETPEEGVLKFLSDAALQSDQDELREENKAVRLMTVHASKGLEFNTVFVTGLEEGLFPHDRMNEAELSPEEAEEERRLFYVALTRARKKVFLSYAETRTIFGRRQVNLPSEFILDIPEELIESEAPEETFLRKPLLEIEF